MKGRPAIPIKEHEDRLALYKKGLSDYAIARELHYSQGAIAKWRRTRGLKTNNPHIGRRPKHA